MQYSRLVDELLTAIPEIRPSFDEESSSWDKVLPHVVFGDVVVPYVIRLLSDADTKPQELTRVFSFLEDMAQSKDELVTEVLGVTVLERLGDDRVVLEAAARFMRECTKALSDQIERGLGRT